MEYIKRLDKLISKGEKVLLSHTPNPPGVIGFPTLDSSQFTSWKSQTLSFLAGFIGDNHEYYSSFKKNVSRGYRSQAKSGIELLKSIKEDYENDHLNPINYVDNSITELDVYSNLERLFERFHKVARQLRSRYDDRSAIDICDEYDVQDLLHALLMLYFEDIRAEEWTPSYAGKSSRMDLLLKNEKTVIEVKKTRSSLKSKVLGTQLIEDIARYKSHPDCETLICFVYDPDGWISNPVGIENDLSTNDDSMNVKVYIRPHY